MADDLESASQPEDASLAAPLILGTLIDPRPGGLAPDRFLKGGM